MTFSLVDDFLGISKNSKSICNKAFCKTTKRWYRDCCSSYWYGWTDKGMGLTFNFMNLLNFMESYIVIVPNTDRHLLSMWQFYADIWEGRKGYLLYCEFSWILPQNGKFVALFIVFPCDFLFQFHPFCTLVHVTWQIIAAIFHKQGLGMIFYWNILKYCIKRWIYM